MTADSAKFPIFIRNFIKNRGKKKFFFFLGSFPRNLILYSSTFSCNFQYLAFNII